MAKPKLYLDTSVINGLFAYDVPWQIKASQELFHKIATGEYKGYTSEVVLEEIKETPDLIRQDQLLEVIDIYSLYELPRTDKSDQLATAYIKENIIPKRYFPDALHIAIAVVNELDILVSWNFEHIVKYQTKVKVNQINQKMDYPKIEILSPEEA